MPDWRFIFGRAFVRRAVHIFHRLLQFGLGRALGRLERPLAIPLPVASSAPPSAPSAPSAAFASLAIGECTAFGTRLFWRRCILIGRALMIFVGDCVFRDGVMGEGLAAFAGLATASASPTSASPPPPPAAFAFTFGAGLAFGSGRDRF